MLRAMTETISVPRTTPTRYADAVRARRAELRAALAEPVGGHRGELRSALALARLSATAETATELTQLTGWAQTYLERSGRADRTRFPAELHSAVDALHQRVSRRRQATVRVAARRVARRRGVPIDPGWPAMEGVGQRQWPPPPVRTGSLWAGGAGGWRTALLPVAVLPAVGLPVAAGSPAVAVALGGGTVALACLHHAAAADRARLRSWSAEVLTTVRTELDAGLARLLIHVEQAAGEDLDAALARHRAELEAELAALVPAPRPAAADA